MSSVEPRVESIATNEVTTTTPWTDGRSQLAQAHRYWLCTVRADGRPHVMPLFGVWLDNELYFTANASTRKARNLAGDPRCVIAASGEGLDLIVEGEAVRVRDDATLRRVADAYGAKYDWPLTVRADGSFDAPYGAPSAGPSPYEPYRFTPGVAFGLGTAEPFGATRWVF
jgi:Pyridoxamine 5'-phosphate oxidase